MGKRKALDGAINSGKEKAIWKAKKEMLKFRSKLRSTHKDWFNDWRSKIKEWKKEYISTKRQIRRAKKLIRKHKRKLRPRLVKQMQRRKELEAAKKLDIQPHKKRKAIKKAKKKLKKADKRVRKSNKKITKYTADYDYFAKELLPKWQ